MVPEYYSREGNHFVRSSMRLDRLDTIYVCHKYSLSRDVNNERRWTFMYLDDRTHEAIIAENQSRLAWIKDFSSITYQEMEKIFERKIGNSVAYSVWSHVVPWHGNKMLGCFELTEVQLIDWDTSEKFQLVDYEPGFSLSGCDFNGIVADIDTIERIKRCGGVLNLCSDPILGQNM